MDGTFALARVKRETRIPERWELPTRKSAGCNQPPQRGIFCDKNSFRIIQKRSQKTIDMTWVEKIEAVLPNLDTIIRNPRRFIVIEEDITITEYDKESGKPIKETHAKRKATQDTDQVATEEEVKGVSEVRTDSLNQFRETTQMMDADIKEESVGGQESFGKWFGIGLSCVVAIFLIYLLRKLRIN